MVAGKSPNWLPSGWTVQVKVTNGRKVEHYSNVETGQKFYSKSDVMRYIKSGNVRKRESTSKRNKRRSERKPTQLAAETSEVREQVPESVKAGNIGKRESTSKRDKRSSARKLTQVRLAAETNEVPEWLPNGWTMELRTRNRGPRIGSKYKCYIAPDTGFHFYSKPEVSQYLQTVKSNSCTSKQTKTSNGSDNNHYIDTTECKSSLKPEVSSNLDIATVKPSTSEEKKVTVGKHSARNVVIERVQTPDELPSGWIKEIKIQRKANGIRKDPYYTDPVSGYMFRSTKDALRYVETGDINKCAIKPKKRDDVTHHYIDKTTECISSLKPEVSHNLNTVSVKPCTSKQKKVSVGKHSARNVVIERVQTPDELPSGWIKEIRIQRKANGIRKDPYYTDPVSGYMFRSTKDALRYVETGDINKCTIKPKKRDDVTHFQSSDYVQNSMHHTTRRQLFSGKESCETSSLVAPESDGSKKRRGKNVSADSVVTSTLTTKILKDNQLVTNVNEKCAEIKESSKPSSSALAKTKGTKRKRGKTVVARHAPLSTPVNDILKDENLRENENEKLSNKKAETNSRKRMYGKVLSSPSRSSKRLLGLKPELASSLGLTEPALLAAFKKPGSSEASGLALNGVVDSVNVANDASRGTDGPSDIEQSNKSEKPLEDQTVPQEQPRTQGPEQKDDENTESNLFSQLGNCWSDPCLEFAFKTLTGAIPVEDNLSIQGYLQQEDDTSNTQREGSSAVVDFGLPSFFQVDLPSHLDVPQQPANIQQFPPNHTILPTGNLSSPGCSNVSPQQPSIERK